MRRLFVTSLVLFALGATACDGDGDGDTTGPPDGDGTAPASIAVVSGDNQRIIVDAQLLAPLRVQVRDSQNRGVSGVTVDWDVTQGGGSLSSTTSTTDSDGEASVQFTAGSSAGESTISASVDGVSGSATFTAVVVTPAAVAATAGDNQELRTGTPAEDLTARVTASDGGPVPGATVAWEVTGGDASLSASTSTADADGRASVGLTAGSSVGAITVAASPEGSAASATFDLQASTPVSITVTMENILFNAPGGGDDVVILLGDTIRWVNNDNTAHTATSQQEPAGGTAFDSGTMNLGDEFVFVPDVRGLWIYFCEFHPVQMRDARITVN